MLPRMMRTRPNRRSTVRRAAHSTNGDSEIDRAGCRARARCCGSTSSTGWTFGGVTVVNDLVFTATLDGMIYALNRKDGSVVWQWQAPGGTNAWPAVAGDTIVWPIGLGDSPMVIALQPQGQRQPADARAAADAGQDARRAGSGRDVNYFVLAHGGEPLAPHDFWSAWTFEPAIVVSLALAILLLRVGNSQGLASRGTGARRDYAMPCVCRGVARPGAGAHVAARRAQRFAVLRAHGPAPGPGACRRAAAGDELTSRWRCSGRCLPHGRSRRTGAPIGTRA